MILEQLGLVTVWLRTRDGNQVRGVDPKPASSNGLRTQRQRFPCTKAPRERQSPAFALVRGLWWACQDLNLGPHPYQPNAGNRCAVGRFPSSRPTVGAKGIGSIGVQICVLFGYADRAAIGVCWYSSPCASAFHLREIYGPDEGSHGRRHAAASARWHRYRPPGCWRRCCEVMEQACHAAAV
jgi:hypothetical protein